MFLSIYALISCRLLIQPVLVNPAQVSKPDRRWCSWSLLSICTDSGKVNKLWNQTNLYLNSDFTLSGHMLFIKFHTFSLRLNLTFKKLSWTVLIMHFCQAEFADTYNPQQNMIS